MRRFLAACLTLSVVLPSLPSTAAAAQEAPDADQLEAQRLYEQGRTAYRLGRFKDAVVAWEKSFELSKGNPLLLYNISLAYRGLYGITGELKDLRQAKAVLDNFIKVAQFDAAQAGELADAESRFAELTKEIEEAERRVAEAASKVTPIVDGGPSEAERARAKRMRLAGAITMGAGGAVFVTGVALGSFYVVKSNEFTNQVGRDRTAVRDALADGRIARDVADQCIERSGVAQAAIPYAADDGLGQVPEALAPCLGTTQNPQRKAIIDSLSALGTTRNNGKRANTLSIVSFAVIGGVGLAAVIAGAVVLAQGNRGARGGGKAARLHFAPTFGGRAGSGFVLHGRF